MIIKTRAQGTGRVVNCSALLKGQLVDQSRWSLSPTTVIPDVIDEVIRKCQELDSTSQLEILSPNKVTTLSFDLLIQGNSFQVTCSRRLARGLFPLNPVAAEFGRNYDAIFNINADESVESELRALLSAYEIH